MNVRIPARVKSVLTSSMFLRLVRIYLIVLYSQPLVHQIVVAVAPYIHQVTPREALAALIAAAEGTARIVAPTAPLGWRTGVLGQLSASVLQVSAPPQPVLVPADALAPAPVAVPAVAPPVVTPTAGLPLATSVTSGAQ